MARRRSLSARHTRLPGSVPASNAAPLRGAYLDSSALVKLVIAEPQTLALRTAILQVRPHWAQSR